MSRFVGGADTKDLISTDRLCDKSRISPALCKLLPELPPLAATEVGCCTYVNCGPAPK